MALARVKTWSSGEVLTASDLNAEFNNVLNNARDLISPLTASLDLNGVELILDADADTSITADTDDQIDIRINGADQIVLTVSAMAFNEQGADIDFRVESDTNQNALKVDAGLFTGVGAIGLAAAATDAAVVLIDNPALTATANTNIAKLRLENTAAITVPAGTTAIAASLSVDEPNLTATGTITAAATVYVEAAPTEGSANYALWMDAGSFRLDANAILTNDGAATVTLPTKTSTLAAAGDMTRPVNVSLAASVAANALTIALKTQDGGDPAAADPAYIPFRNATAATGDFTVITQTAALSIVIPDTATLGTVSGDMARLYVYAVNDGGTLKLGVYNPVSGTGNTVALKSLNVGDVQSSTVIGIGSDSAQTLYTDTAGVTSKAVCWLGFVEIVEATAGTWATSPTLVTLAGNGVKYTGDLVQVVNAISAGSTTASSTDADVTNATVSITPSSRCNLLECHVDYHQVCANQTGVTAGSTATVTDATPTAYRTAKTIKGTDTASNIIVEANGAFHFYAKPDSTSAQTVKLQHASVNNSDTITTDDVGIVVKEIFA